MKPIVTILLFSATVTASAQAAPPPVTKAYVDSLHVLSDPALLVMPGKFTPSHMQQYLVSSGTPSEGEVSEFIHETSILFFSNGKYDHKVVLPQSGGGGLSEGSIRQFENSHIRFGHRHGEYYVADFNGTGLDQIFMLQEFGNGNTFSVFGYNGHSIARLLTVPLSWSYVYPIQTLGPGEIKVFPYESELESLSPTPQYKYRFKYRYVVYKWNKSTWRFEQAETGMQIAWADPKTALVYPILDNSDSGK